MLENHILNTFKEKLGFAPTPGQEELLQQLAAFVANPESEPYFLLKGYAGTGKTSVIAALVRLLDEFKIKSVLLAPTGRAAKVLAKYSGKPAFTIHKKIYRQKSLNDELSKFSLEKNLHTNTFFIVDEASMISNTLSDNAIFGTGRLLDDLMTYVESGTRCKLILVGDSAQLPPVGLPISQALELKELKHYGDWGNALLNDVVRQTEESGILFNATRLRKQIEEENLAFPTFSTKPFTDINAVAGYEVIEAIGDSYGRYGIDESMILCRSNKRANRYNQGIRKHILFRDEEIERGDRLMVVKNCYQFLGENEKIDFIANGDIAEIVRIKKYEERYGFRYANVTLNFPDYDDMELDCKILLDTLTLESASLSADNSRNLFLSVAEDYAHIRTKRKRYNAIREDPYFNALQVKFAYAITCHKAQGGQWKNVFIDQPYFKDDTVTLEDLRWLYTAITRSTEQLQLINFDAKWFD